MRRPAKRRKLNNQGDGSINPENVELPQSDSDHDVGEPVSETRFVFKQLFPKLFGQKPKWVNSQKTRVKLQPIGKIDRYTEEFYLEDNCGDSLAAKVEINGYSNQISKTLHRFDMLCQNYARNIRPTHYICIPLGELIPQYDTIMSEVNDFYKHELCPPKFSDSTRCRLHLTLLMLTPTKSDDFETIETVLKAVCDEFKETKLMLTLDSLGTFHDGDLIYSAPTEIPDWLSKLRNLIYTNLSKSGVLTEDANARPYLPHVTLLRHSKNKADAYDSEELVSHLSGFGLGTTQVKRINFLKIGGNQRTEFCLGKENDITEPISTSFLRRYIQYARTIRQFCGL